MAREQDIELKVNGRVYAKRVSVRTSLGDFLRDQLHLTGTHLGCEHGVCGACVVMVDGLPVRSCINFAATCDGARVRTIEGFDGDPLMQALRDAFKAEHALQCGYCTPGMLMAAKALLDRNPTPSREDVIDAISGNLCRCTGYEPIVEAILAAAKAPRHSTGRTA